MQSGVDGILLIRGQSNPAGRITQTPRVALWGTPGQPSDCDVSIKFTKTYGRIAGLELLPGTGTLQPSPAQLDVRMLSGSNPPVVI